MQETQETWLLSLGQEDPLEKEITMRSNMLAWKIPWTEESGSLWCPKEPDTSEHTHTHTHTQSFISICVYIYMYIYIYIYILLQAFIVFAYYYSL